VRKRLRDTINARVDVWAAAHEERGDERGIDPDINMRALLVLLVSADLDLGVLEALGVDVPPPEEWGALIRALSARSKGTEATDLKREAAVHLGDADRRFD
jgi:hypothetical protein